MAKQLSYNSRFGAIFPESYWRLAHTSLGRFDNGERFARLHFIGYASQQAATANAQPVGEEIMSVVGKYDQFFAYNILEAGTNPVRQGYLACVEPDDEGNPSPFAGAINV